MSYCVLCFAYCPYRIERKAQINGTVIYTVTPNTVSQNDEKLHTAELDDTAIPHVKMKITEITCEKKPNTSTTQIWVVTHHQYAVSAIVPLTSFR